MNPPTSPKRRFKSNVTWLLGPQLINGLWRIVSYWLMRRTFDQRSWMTATVDRRFTTPPANGEPLWWDYIADTGDGQLAMYNLATLLYSDLHEGEARQLAFEGDPERRLPRGSFLLCGGDTAYHVADRATLAVQFQAPFQWAWADLVAAGRVSELDPRRPLYGLPGNHDYYDELDGFGRQFRRPLVGEDHAELALPGFERLQTASYSAIALPHGWWLWAIDLELGSLDLRQRQFFASIHPGGSPARLIVATPEPSTFDGIRARPTDTISVAFAQLGLEAAFLDEPLRPGRCRLDLSGDTHNYQRYAGPAEYGGAARYASVVSGGGGAFLQSTSIDFGQVPRRAVFPPPEVTRTRIALLLLSWRTLARSGLVAAIGGAMITMLYVATSFVPSTRTMFANVLGTVFGLCHERTSWRAVDGACTALPAPTAYCHALWILGSIIACTGLAVFASRFANGKPPGVPHQIVSDRRYNWSAALVLAATALPWVTVTLVGDQPAADVYTDVLSAALVAGLVVGLLVTAVSRGASNRGFAGACLFAAFGAFHAAFQLFVPLTLLRMFSWQALAVDVGIFAVASVVGRWLVRRGSTWPLVALWLAAGLGLLVLPRLASGNSTFVPDALAPRLAAVAAAFIVGWVSTSVQLGWYFMATFMIGGHGIEAATVARIGDYKEFIRFRLDPDGSLTGHVIAFAAAQPDGCALRPYLADKFTIRSDAA